MTVNEALFEIKDIHSGKTTCLLTGKNTPAIERCLLRSCNALTLAEQSLEKQIPQEVVNQGGAPLSGHCPRCNAELTKPSSPVGCKWCLQRLEWRDEE